MAYKKDISGMKKAVKSAEMKKIASKVTAPKRAAKMESKLKKRAK